MLGATWVVLGRELWVLVILRAKHSGAVYCVVYCLWRKDGRTAGGVCGRGRAVSVTTITRNCEHQSVGAGSDRLQLIKFWRSCAPGKGVCGRGNFGSALLQPSRTL